jgi:predicted RND superfamily exporter protein
MKFGNLKSVVEKYAYLWPFAFTALIILVVVVAAAVSVPNASVTPAVPNSLALETYLDENEENGDVQVIAVKVLEADPNTPPAVAELRFSYEYCRTRSRQDNRL